MVEDDYRQEAEFNSAFEYLNRINSTLALAGESKYSMDSYGWASSLSILFAELSTKMTKKELADNLPELKDLLRITSNTSIKGKISFDLYWRLFNFELFLRRVFKDSGLEMKFKEDSRGVLLGGGK